MRPLDVKTLETRTLEMKTPEITQARSFGQERLITGHWQRLSMKRKGRHRRKEGRTEHWEKEDTERRWQRWRMNKIEFVFTCKDVRPQAGAVSLSYVGSLRVYMYMKSYRIYNNKFVLGPWRLSHWSCYRLCRGSVLLRCGEVAFMYVPPLAECFDEWCLWSRSRPKKKRNMCYWWSHSVNASICRVWLLGCEVHDPDVATETQRKWNQLDSAGLYSWFLGWGQWLQIYINIQHIYAQEKIYAGSSIKEVRSACQRWAVFILLGTGAVNICMHKYTIHTSTRKYMYTKRESIYVYIYVYSQIMHFHLYVGAYTIGSVHTITTRQACACAQSNSFTVAITPEWCPCPWRSCYGDPLCTLGRWRDVPRERFSHSGLVGGSACLCHAPFVE